MLAHQARPLELENASMNWLENLPPAPQLIKMSALTFVGALICWIIANHESHEIRPPLRAPPEMSVDPIQTPTASPPFIAKRGGENYEIEPVAEYEITGLVVQLHDSMSWQDSTHLQAKDFINTRDLCVVWGDNLKNDIYRRVRFSHGDWTCYYQAFDAETFRLFKGNQLSNNHVLPATDSIAANMEKIEIGDQITLKGMLVNYQRAQHPPPRKTSTTRDDTGNGACEIIWVTDFQMRHRAAKSWRAFRSVSLLALTASLLTLISGFALGLVRR